MNSANLKMDRLHYAPGYAQVRIEFQRQRRADTHTAFFLPNLREDARILDCGCGTGSITNDLATKAHRGFSIGVDIAESQVRIARRAARDSGSTNAFYEQQDACDLEFSDGTFDVVLAHALMDHVLDSAQAVREMVRVLRPGGILALRSPDWSKLLIASDCSDGHRCVQHYLDRIRTCGGDPAVSGKFEALLRSVGMRDIRLSCSVETHHPATLFARAVCAALTNVTSGAAGNSSSHTRTSCQSFCKWASASDSRIAETWNEALARKAPHP